MKYLSINVTNNVEKHLLQMQLIEIKTLHFIIYLTPENLKRHFKNNYKKILVYTFICFYFYTLETASERPDGYSPRIILQENYKFLAHGTVCQGEKI